MTSTDPNSTITALPASEAPNALPKPPLLPFDEAVADLCSSAWAPSGSHIPSARSDLVLRSLLPASRRQEGRVALGASPGAIPNLVMVLRDPTTHHEPLGQRAMRILRNLCVRSPANQTRAREAQAHDVIISSLDFALRSSQSSPSYESEPSRLYTPFHGFAVEFLVNFVTGNEVNVRDVWHKMFSKHLFSNIMKGDNKAAAEATGALVHNCVVAVPEYLDDVFKPVYLNSSSSHHPESDVGNTNEPQGKSQENYEMSTLLYTIISLMMEEEKAASKTSDNSEDSVEQFSWSFLIVQRLINAGKFAECFNSLGSPLDTTIHSELSKHEFSKLQRTFLHLLDAASGNAAETSNSTNPATDLTFPPSNMSFLCDVLDAAFFSRDAVCLRVLSSLIASIIILSPDSSAELDDMRLRTIKVAIAILHAAPTENKTDEWRGMKATMVRAIAVSCDEFKRGQDSVRDLGGIPAVLNSMAYEEDSSRNPYMREWAVLAIRNITWGNARNVEEINGLEFKGLKNEQWLEKAGLEAFEDPKTGRPRVRQKHKASSAQ